MPRFDLDPRLAADSLPVADLDLATVRLMSDSRFPWLLVIPQRPDLVDLIDLAPAEQVALMAELDRVARALKAETGCPKLNVAALGNMVPQLHVHVIARFPEDAAWPGPVWGVGTAEPYAPEVAQALASRLAARLVDAG
ncbi:HIT family protein [Stappia sp.]|uniref:HIT family protein n=1 Tax=Stappia sp. TaxID=1870903 RepID=UPI0032D98AE1